MVSREEWARLKRDPERAAKYLARRRAYNARPVVRERNRLRRERYMVLVRGDPVRYAAYLETRKNYLRSRRGNISVCLGCRVIKRFCECPNKEVK